MGDTPNPRHGLRPCTPLRRIGGHPQTPVMGDAPAPRLSKSLGTPRHGLPPLHPFAMRGKLGDTPIPRHGLRLCTPTLRKLDKSFGHNVLCALCLLHVDA